jgi:hypothetical protein
MFVVGGDTIVDIVHRFVSSSSTVPAGSVRRAGWGRRPWADRLADRNGEAADIDAALQVCQLISAKDLPPRCGTVSRCNHPSLPRGYERHVASAPSGG